MTPGIFEALAGVRRFVRMPVPQYAAFARGNGGRLCGDATCRGILAARCAEGASAPSYKLGAFFQKESGRCSIAEHSRLKENSSGTVTGRSEPTP